MHAPEAGLLILMALYKSCLPSQPINHAEQLCNSWTKIRYLRVHEVLFSLVQGMLNACSLAYTD
jgi:hypothetical protein